MSPVGSRTPVTRIISHTEDMTQDIDIFIDARFEAEYARHPLTLVDVGARGGVKRNWSAAMRHLRVLGFEPDRREYDRLVESARSGAVQAEYFNVALHDRRGSVPLYIARDRGLS